MATKYQFITGVYESTIGKVTQTPAAWTAFLRSACRNYKCRFDEQILIYVQRPAATAVLEIEKWNKQFGRWVNRGATGIAVFDDEHNGNYRLKHYFDISDTHESQFARTVPLWSMRPEYEADVIESLENSFGDLDDKSTLADAIISAARNAVEDNMADYLADLMNCRDGSVLEQFDDEYIKNEYRFVLHRSVAYMVLTRCGINADKYLSDFRPITNFDTRNTVNALGLATSDIAENCLREISATVINLGRAEQNKNRTFAMPETPAHNVPIKQNDERSADNGTDLSDGGRLSPAQPDLAGGTARSRQTGLWQIRIAPKELSETAPPHPVRESADVGQAERTPDGDRADGERAHGADNRADGGDTGRDGADESRESNAVGRDDEQHPAQRGGNDTQRPDIQLKPLPTIAQQLTLTGEAEEVQSSAFSISQQIIDEVLTSGGNELDSVLRIAAYFKKDHITAENADFLQSEYRQYGNSGKGFIFGGNHVSIWFEESGIRIATGDTAINADYSTLVTWEQAARRIRELLDMGRFMPQSELDKVDGNEIKSLAEKLYFLYRDEMGTLPQEWTANGPLHADSIPVIAEQLCKPDTLELVIKKLDGDNQIAKSVARDEDFRWIRAFRRDAPGVLRGLTDLQREPLVFTADESVSSARPGFITQDEIDKVLIGGDNVQDGKYRIYAYFLQDHTAKEKADFLKHEYGTGGGSRTGFNEWHDSKGIAYSRENNHMPYDKVILSWPKVARRIDELITDGKYMSQRELDYIPEYEKGELTREIYWFYYNKPEDVPCPYPDGVDYYDAVKAIRPQLDEPERVAEILNGMAAVLDNTADFDKRYKSMRKEFNDLTAYQNGTFSLFMPANKPTEQAQARQAAPKRPATPTPSADPAAEYDLQLGAAVYIGMDEYEIYSFDDSHVVLRDMSAPLFTRDMPRDEFDRKLRENRLNDGLIMADTAPAPAVVEETPRILYKKYLPILLEEIRKGELHDFLRAEDTDPLAAETEIGKELDSLAESIGEDEPAFYAAYNDEPQFSDWLFEDIFERTYQDISVDERDRVTQHEGDADAPEWVKRPAPEPHTPKRGDRYELQGRRFVVDSVDTDGDSVKLRDITFEGNTGFPIFRSESLDFIRMYDPIQPEPEMPLANNQPKEEISGLKSIVIDLRPREAEPVVNYPGEIVLEEVHIPRYTVEAISYVDVISSNPPRVDIADKAHAYGVWDGQRYLKNDDGTYVTFDTYGEADAYAAQLNAADTELTPAWEKPKPRNRTQTFDPHPEIPMSERHNFVITDDTLGHGGAKTKYRGNVEAIRTLQAVESENRFATPEEQEILSRYVGWGSLADAFDESKPTWTNEYVELKSLLSPEDYASARATTLNAHYTSPTVIKAIYKAVKNMGFKTGNVLEPSCGVGNFFGLLPESMSGSKLFGVELDDLTGRIARQLYQKNSIAIQGFENTQLPDSFFDLAIGNVPFGGYGVLDKRYDKHKFHIHDYFFAKTLDKVRPGGVMAFVTSKWMMDKKNPTIRKYIAQRADLLGAIRLPMNAFMANAGTEVTTDIIFLQKRDRITDIEPDWVHLGETDNGIPVNSYFAEHPDMMLGTMSNDSGVRMYGAANSTSCVPFPDSDLSEQLADAITNIHAEITDYERGEDEPEEDNSIPADPNVRNFSYTLVDGQIYYRQDSRMIPVALPATTQSRVKGMIKLRECVRDLIMYQTEGYPDSDIKAEQAKLNRLYDDFTRKYGLINSRGNSMAFSQDSAYCLLCSLEVIDENGELERKADMFQKRTIKPHEPVTHVDTASEALAVSMSEKARVDLPYMAELTGMSEDALVKELSGVIFLNIGGAATQDKAYVTADEYLSGNVREKLAQAKAAQVALNDGSVDANVKALEAALPGDLSAGEISVRLGATWLPEDVIERFTYELLQPSGYARERIKVHYYRLTGEWNITEKNADRSNIHTFNSYGTQRMNAYKIIEESLNLRDVRIFDRDPNDDKKRILNKKETAIAQNRQDKIKRAFRDWIWTDPERRERLCAKYNKLYNSTRPREFDGSHLTFPGMNPEIKLESHQKDAVARILYGQNTLLAHVVGAGKSATRS